MNARTEDMTVSGAGRHRSRGFTLIELMVVLVVVGILAAIAVPQYSAHVARTNRAEAKAALMGAAQWMEQRFSANGTYCSTADDCSTNPLPTSMRTVPATGSAVYELTVTNLADATYTLTATPASTGKMSGDACGAFTLNQLGQRGQGGLDEASCWRR